MKSVKILGPGCKKCKQLDQNVRDAVSALGVEMEVTKVEDMQEMLKYGIMSSPGLVVDEKVLLTGKVPSVDELKGILSK